MRAVFGVVVAALAAVLAAQASAAPAAARSCSSGQVEKTRSYVFALSVGPMETMYTPAEVKAKHPKRGEVMISGSMTSGMAGMTMPMNDQRHLEVHICTPSGAVVTGAHPRIVVVDTSGKGMTMIVPVAVMEGIGAGTADLHYGNNVTLTAGHRITVKVLLNGQTAVFRTVVGHASM